MAIIDELKTRMEFEKEAILKCYPCASTCIEALICAQKAIDIAIIPQLYVRWVMIDGEKPTWYEYATKAMEEQL